MEKTEEQAGQQPRRRSSRAAFRAEEGGEAGRGAGSTGNHAHRVGPRRAEPQPRPCRSDGLRVRRFTRRVSPDRLNKSKWIAYNLPLSIVSEYVARLASPLSSTEERNDFRFQISNLGSEISALIESEPCPQITAKLVNELRNRTGQGMMECKKMLTESGGDIEKAIDGFRKKGVKA